MLISCLICNIYCYKLEDSSSKLAKFVCNIVKCAKREDSGLNTVDVIFAESNLDPSTINDILWCIPDKISCRMMNLTNVQNENWNLLADFVVMLADRANEVNIQG